MNRTEKQEIISDLCEKFNNYNSVYIIDHIGMSVKDMNDMRKVVYNEGMFLKVVKNTFIKKASEACGGRYEPIYDTLHGVSALLFSNTANMPAKLIKQIRKNIDNKPLLKGAYIEGTFYLGDNQLDLLAQLKSKEELIGDVIGLLQSPIKNVISSIQQSSAGKIHSLLSALASR